MILVSPLLEVGLGLHSAFARLINLKDCVIAIALT